MLEKFFLLTVLLTPLPALGGPPPPPPPPAPTKRPPPPPPPPAVPAAKPPTAPPAVNLRPADKFSSPPRAAAASSSTAIAAPAALVTSAPNSPSKPLGRGSRRDHGNAGGALLLGAVTSITASIGLQALALRQILKSCPVPELQTLSACVGDEPAVVAAGAAGAVFGVTGVGLAAGGGWEIGKGRRQRRVTQVLGALMLGVGLSTMAGSRLARLNAAPCETAQCAGQQGFTDLAVRNAGLVFVASGAAVMTAHAQTRRTTLAPVRYAGGFGLTLMISW